MLLIISTTKRGSEHTNLFAKQWVFQTSVSVQNMTWKGIETLPDFSLKLRIDQG